MTIERKSTYGAAVTGATLAWLSAAAVAAVANWIAVARGDKTVEYVAKPAATLALLAAAVALIPAQDSVRLWVVAALALCLAGDVFLMLPQDLFVAGLASFLVGHVLFVVAFLTHHPRHTPLPTVVIAVVAVPLLLRPIVSAVRRDHADLLAPVVVYAAVIGAMLAVSSVTGSALAVAGALDFVTSDTILATNRFVRPLPQGHVATMVTYHAALALLVLSVV
jgi:uncharacterized membrane protein YhhN